MTETHLPHRAVIEIVGTDAPVFLERVLTNEVATHPEGETRYTGLLTPQGKIIVDFLIARAPDENAPHFFLDVPGSEAEALKKRLTMFRLRSDAVITLRDDLSVWHRSDEIETTGDVACILRDPRHEAAGFRVLRASNTTDEDRTRLEDWHQARIRMGLAEFGFDFGAAEVFPSDINMDILGGVDLKKGCFVGQEVVSRMHRRGKIRRRTFVIHGAGPMPASSRLESASSGLIGTITSSSGNHALARIRVDRLVSAEAAGDIINVEGNPVTVEKPDWLQGEIDVLTADD